VCRRPVGEPSETTLRRQNDALVQSQAAFSGMTR
jgi:hypothetical protein